MIQKKICMVGLFGVGKTSLVRRFVDSIFDDRYLTTIGVKIDKKQVSVGGQDVNLMIWDLVGEDDFAQVRLSHLRGASGYLLVADGCRQASLDTAQSLYKRVTEALGPLPFILVVNKADLKERWEIQPAAIEALRKEGWTTVESSAKEGAGVEDIFLNLAERMLKEPSPAPAGNN